MFEEARNGLLLDAPVRLGAPVDVLQGKQGERVPWRHALTLTERIEGPDVRLDLIEAGDHRLSTPADLTRLVEAVERLR